MSRTALALALVSSLSLFACAGQYGSSGPGAMAGAAPVGGDTSTAQPQPWHERTASAERAQREPAHQQRDIRDLSVHARDTVTCRQCR